MKKIQIGKFAFISILVIIFIFSTLLGIFLQYGNTEDAINTAGEYWDDLIICDKKLKIYQDFFNEDIEVCSNKEFKGQINIENVPSWINNGYYCDLKRITDQRPENVNYLSRWNSTITCYRCNTP